MTRVLYMSYTGILTPLGQSQVLQYILGLSKGHNISLLSFERVENLADTENLEVIKKLCTDHGIDWTVKIYHNRPGIPATIYDVITGVIQGLKIARNRNIQVLHARSYIAGLMALMIKKRRKVKFLFDMRGFWPDERVDGGIWKRSSARYRVFKRLEKVLFKNADYVVSLTHSGVREIEKFDFLSDAIPPITVIPTCTNLKIFTVAPSYKTDDRAFTLGYVGSVGSWYMFDEVARFVRILFETDSAAKFLIINKSEHEKAAQKLIAAGVDMARVKMISSPYDQVAAYISQMDAGIFFILPVFSKRASCPTRLGEFLACGKPCLANTGVGDVEDDLSGEEIGISIAQFDDKTFADALAKLRSIASNPKTSKLCRQVAEEIFSLDHGVSEYNKIYERLGAL